MTGKREAEIAGSFAEIALADSKCASILYSKKHYPQACYMLQQSVEKSSKAFGLLIGTVRPEELHREVGHLSSLGLMVHFGEWFEHNRRVLTEAFEKFQRRPRAKGLMARQAAKMFPAVVQALQLFQRVNVSSLKFSAKSLLKEEKTMWELSLNLTGGPSVVSDAIASLKNKKWEPKGIVGSAIFTLDTLSGFSPPLPQFVLFLRMYRVSWRIGPLAFLTMWHEETTRYPKVMPPDFGSPSDYKEETPFVREFEMMNKHANVCASELVKCAELVANGVPMHFDNLLG